MSASSSSSSSSPSCSSSSSFSDVKASGFFPADRIKSFLEPTVWHHMTPLCQQHKAINLGQGFPGWSPPDFVKDAAGDAVHEKNGLNYLANQYARSQGNLMLVEKLGSIYSERLNRKIDHISEIIVTNGATGAIFNITQGLLNAGDEVVVFEPAFDIYIADTAMCGATVKTVPMFVKNGVWTFDMDAFKNAFSSKTRLVLLNTPHNPTGKIFTLEELQSIGQVVKQYPRAVVLADEVYEKLIYEDSGKSHLHIAALPEMWERTITVSSAGKTFSATGWKVGWVVGPAHLIRCVGIVQSWVSFSVNTPSQIAVAKALDLAEQQYRGADSYYTHLLGEYTKKRDFMMKTLSDVGMKPVCPEGSFFIMADTSSLQDPSEWAAKYPHESRDWHLARWLTVEIGVACIPPSAFYQDNNKHLAHNLLRFAICQSDEMLQEAAKRLEKVKKYLKKN